MAQTFKWINGLIVPSYPHKFNTCFFPLFPFFFPFPPAPSPSSPSSPLSPPLPLPPAALELELAAHGFEDVATAFPPLFTMPFPYPKIVLWGLAAGGKAGKALVSFPTFLLAGRDDGGVGRAEPGAEFDADAEDEAAHETVEILPVDALGLLDDDADGRPGKGLMLVDEAGEAEGDAEPHDRVCDTEERDD